MTLTISPVANISYLKVMASGKPNTGMKFWIASKDFVLDGFADDKTPRLNVYSPDMLLNAIASDCNRFALAACESFCGITYDNLERNGLAWTIIRIYYATFFAIHALSRLFGHSCTNVPQEHARIIEEMLSLSSPGIKVDSGTYDFYTTPDGRYSTMTKIDHSHAGAWKIFAKVINDIRKEIECVSTTSQNILSIISVLEVVRDAVGANAAWLSAFRNDVNYQHAHNAWYPGKIKKEFHRQLPTIATTWGLNEYRYSFSDDSGVLSFFQRSSIVLRFFYDAIVSCEQKNNGAGKILKNGFFKLLRSMKC